MPSLEVVEAVLVQCNTLNVERYLLNVEPSNLVFLISYNTEFGETIITFTDQNGRPLEIKDRINLALFINK